MKSTIADKSKSKRYETKNKGPLPYNRGGSLSREKATKIYGDHPAQGIIFYLIAYAHTCEWLSLRDLESLVLWRHRTLKEAMNKIIKKSCLEDSIYTKLKNNAKGIKVNYYRIDPQIRDFIQACVVMERSYYKNTWGPNRPEKTLEDFLLEFGLPGWTFNGDNKKENRILNLRPDFRLEEFKLLLEFNGSYWHSKKITGIDETIHEMARVRKFAEAGYKTLVTWEDLLKTDKKGTFDRILKFQELAQTIELSNDPIKAGKMYVKFYKENFLIPR